MFNVTNISKVNQCFCCCSVIKLCPTLCDLVAYKACQVPLSMGFPRQEYWSGLSFSFSKGPSWPKNRTCVSSTGRQILYHWATRELFFYAESNYILRRRKVTWYITYLETFQNALLSSTYFILLTKLVLHKINNCL